MEQRQLSLRTTTRVREDGLVFAAFTDIRQATPGPFDVILINQEKILANWFRPGQVSLKMLYRSLIDVV